MKAVILAAGRGKRMKSLTNNTPKCLLRVGDKTILEHQIESLHNCGIKDIIIVVGYQKEKIKDKVKRFKGITLIENERYEETDNTYSLYLTKPCISDSIIILDGDLIFDPFLLKMLVKSRYKNEFIADFKKEITKEDAKVVVKNGFATAVGKDVNGSAVYMSICKLSGRFLKMFMDELFRLTQICRSWYSLALNNLLNKERVHVMDSLGLLWIEIDTPHELEKAREIYKKIKEGSKHS